jgi:hypothetical protein
MFGQPADGSGAEEGGVEEGSELIGELPESALGAVGKVGRGLGRSGASISIRSNSVLSTSLRSTRYMADEADQKKLNPKAVTMRGTKPAIKPSQRVPWPKRS